MVRSFLGGLRAAVGAELHAAIDHLAAGGAAAHVADVINLGAQILDLLAQRGDAIAQRADALVGLHAALTAAVIDLADLMIQRVKLRLLLTDLVLNLRHIGGFLRGRGDAARLLAQFIKKCHNIHSFCHGQTGSQELYAGVAFLIPWSYYTRSGP